MASVFRTLVALNGFWGKRVLAWFSDRTLRLTPTRRWGLVLSVVICDLLAPVGALAGGSAFSTLVVLNQSSSNSCELANYYIERRQIPPENVVRIAWAGGNTNWTADEFRTNLLDPLLAAINQRGLSNQIDYVVLSMDIPFQTVNGVTVNSTTSALFYGLKPDGSGGESSYAFSEAGFRQSPPVPAPAQTFLATMLTADTLEQAKRLVDQGIDGDRTYPFQPVLLAKTSDPARNILSPYYDNAVLQNRVLGRITALRTNSDLAPQPGRWFGLATGRDSLPLSAGLFLPGALVNNVTSFGGVIFGPNSQTTLLDFARAGAAGSYGTVGEPYSNPQKFPNPMVYFYQARGFSLAESYYQSVGVPFLGLILGDPLSAPFAVPASGRWPSAATNSLLSGSTSLPLRFGSNDPKRPLNRIDLLVDGKYWQTITNLGPAAGNVIQVSVNGFPCVYSVPTGSSLASVATGLVTVINAVSNLTGTAAEAHGDRVELRLAATNATGFPWFLADTNAVPGETRTYRVSYLPDLISPVLTPLGWDRAGNYEVQAETAPGIPFSILASTNLLDWMPLFFNPAGGAASFLDTEAASYPRRFYRGLAAVPDARPMLSISAAIDSKPLIHVSPGVVAPYELQVSTNFLDWSSVWTNLVGSTLDYVDQPATGAPARVYRAVVRVPPPTAPSVSVLGAGAGTAPVVRVDPATKPYVIEATTNQTDWFPVRTNLSPYRFQLQAGSSAGSNETLCAFADVARSYFLESTACGLATCNLDGTLKAGSWVQMSIVRTNGATNVFSLTNQVAGKSFFSFAQELTNRVNSCQALQGGEGVVMEDLKPDPFGSPSWHARARGEGLSAAGILVALRASSGVYVTPWAPVALRENLADLQPRNHIYLSAGAGRLAVVVPFDTRTLPDGFHDLTAIAYEGSHVATATRANWPVQIVNTSLSASLALVNSSPTNLVRDTLEFAVTASTNDISLVSLFTTGGLVGAATNQPNPRFQVPGGYLGAGLHPFYAVVESASGLKYRTRTVWTRLAN